MTQPVRPRTIVPMTLSQTSPSAPASTQIEETSRARVTWQRAGGALLIAGGISLGLKFGLLLAFHPDPIPHFGVAPGESALITIGLICTYAGSSALVLPLLSRRPAWTLALAAPLAVVIYILVAGVLMGLGNAAAGGAANSVLRNETGVLVYAIFSAAVGAGLLQLARRGRT